MLESLINSFQDCSMLLKKLKTENAPNPISFLVSTSHIISSIKAESEKYLSISNLVLNSLVSLSQVAPKENVDYFLEHDPGKRSVVKTSSQRKYLLSLGPHQPKLAKFPKNLDITPGKQCQFSSLWYNEYPHLEYSLIKDAAFCFICTLFPNGPNRNYSDSAWSEIGVRSWHKMKGRGIKKPGKLHQHFTSNAHKSALIDFSNFLNFSGHIECILNKKNREQAINDEHQNKFNQEVLNILFDITRMLSRQGLAFRGDGSEENGNFNQIVLLLSKHNAVLKKWLDDKAFRKHNVTYMSHDSQNEFIDLLSNEVKKKIIQEVKEADIYSVMADTTPDISHRDQLSVCVRYVNAAGEISERLLEIIEASDKTGLGIAETIESVIINNELPPKNVVFQSYDFASSMSGKINGTQQKLSELLGHTVLFIPCQAHRINTFLEHSCNASVIVGDLFLVLEHMYVFFSSSTKRYAHLQKSLSEIENSLQLRNLSKTRWTARAESIKAVWVSFDSIVKTLEEMSTAQYFDKNTRSQALGIAKKILTFDFVVTLYFMKNVMYKMKILTESFEAKDLNIIDALMLLNSSTDIFNDINNDSIGMDNLIDSSINYAHQLNINPESDFNKIHRRRLLPKRLDSNPSSQAIFDLKTFYRSEFKKVLDTLTTLTSEHLKKCIATVEPLFNLLKVPLSIKHSAEDFEKIINLFPPGCSVSNIKDFDAVYSEYLVLAHRCKDAKNVLDILNVSEMYKNILPNMNKILRLMFTAPVSTASNERAFSKLKLIKNFLRSTMNADRLQNLMLLNTNKDILDTIDTRVLVKKWSHLKHRRIEV